MYSAMVTGMDDAIGRVVRTLKEKGLYDNSIILFSSDVSFSRTIRDGKLLFERELSYSSRYLLAWKFRTIVTLVTFTTIKIWIKK